SAVASLAFSAAIAFSSMALASAAVPVACAKAEAEKVSAELAITVNMSLRIVFPPRLISDGALCCTIVMDLRPRANSLSRLLKGRGVRNWFANGVVLGAGVLRVT